METLSRAETLVINEYAKGYSDKEVADRLDRSVWTIKTQKRTVYRKLGISKDTELILYIVCQNLKKDFDLKEIRKHGIEILFSILFLVMQCISKQDVYRMKTRTVTRTCRVIRARKNVWEV